MKICLRLKTVKINDEFKNDPNNPQYKEIQIELSRFESAEIAFSSDFRINHFGYDSKRFYNFIKEEKLKGNNHISHVIESSLKQFSIKLK